MSQILVVDDRADIRLSIAIMLEDNGHQIVEADSPQKAQLQIKAHTVSLILLDMNFALDTTSGDEGLSFLSWLSSSNIDIPVIAMTAWSNIDLVIQAMKLGAKDFIEKPWRNKQLLHCIEQQLTMTRLNGENLKLKQQLDDNNKQFYQWQSACMQQLFANINTVASTDVNILLTGENGTGKSELAQYIHGQSTVKEHTMVAVNMGAISESLFESEMFGHTRGAFTDAKSSRIGRFELAENSTLFLDEIANIPLSQQAKLLRVLENGHYELVGSSQTKQANCRIISATNGNISQLIKDEKFRDDLYYRLNTIECQIPSLKERQSDILPLSEFFISKYALKYQREPCQLSNSAQRALQDYHWPGNIRELSHLLQRAILLNTSGKINVEHLHLSVNKSSQSSLPNMTLKEAEIALIKQVLQQTNNHIPQAAVLLGLTKSSMYRRIEKYNLV
jgi:DNA-binding NtrC family response regulator